MELPPFHNPDHAGKTKKSQWGKAVSRTIPFFPALDIAFFFRYYEEKFLGCPLFFRSIDLRGTGQIIVAVNELGLTKIKYVKLYPKFYKKGTDYSIEIAHDKKSAAVTLLKPAKFKNERVVPAVK